VKELDNCQHCLSVVKKVRIFMDCVLVTLNVDDDDYTI